MPDLPGLPTGNSAYSGAVFPDAPEDKLGARFRDIINSLRGFGTIYPDLMSQITGQILPTEQAKLGAAQAVAPGYAGLQTSLLQNYGPQIQALLGSLQGQQAQTNAGILGGAGRDVTAQTLENMRLADPEFFSTREKTSQGLNELLTPGLTGGERAEVERSLNRSNQNRGTLATPTNLSTVENASRFGQASRDKLGDAIARATAFLPGSKSGAFNFEQATGGGGSNNLGLTLGSVGGIGAPQDTSASTLGTALGFGGGSIAGGKKNPPVNSDNFSLSL